MQVILTKEEYLKDPDQALEWAREFGIVEVVDEEGVVVMTMDAQVPESLRYKEEESEILEAQTRKQVFMPKVDCALKALGERIKLARKRRNISAELLAERAGINSRTTYRKIEKGDPGVSMGKYVMVLYSLGLIDDLDRMAEDDVLGRKLQDIALKQRVGRSTTPLTSD